MTYVARSTKVMFSAISATRFASREAMIWYAEGGWAPFTAPFMDLGAFEPPTGFFDRETGALLAVRCTGADATEAGILTGFW